MAQQIAAVRRDLDIEDRVFGKKRRDRVADLCLRRENKKAVAVLRKAELAGAAKHSLRLDAAKLARLDLEIADENGARQCERNLVAHLVILRAANNLARLAAAVV